ncbi:hypothetical protein MMYC01_207560 [Madurella mycetomatis]|uniref:Heterokaryon incompatibility domain-containing protein n=1 Tax=Madurella mycetomatis TaxID=100816 RepID=A0A175W1Q0_9PEZI|nr:hypothetical protein MMYC01_207560 [Madurella mycetomatis]
MEYALLTRRNLRRLFSLFPESNLPQTFQDVIAAAKKLGVSYIWIDALCIIQGTQGVVDPDWFTEGRKMADIYSGSYCNIAATTTTNPLNSIFSQRIQDRWFAGGCCLVRAKHSRLPRYRRTCVVTRADIWERETVGLPLFRRPWILQERFLAPRTLHFGRTQALWECGHLVAFEAFPGGFPELGRRGTGKSSSDRDQDLSQRWKHQKLALMSRWSSGRTDFDLANVWKLCVEELSRCDKLSSEADKLPAISGIAKVLKQGLKCHYLAGLWETNLVKQLLWVSAHPEGAVRPASYRAPSWSWASMDGFINYPDFWEDFDVLETVQVLDWHIETEDGDEEFQVLKGTYLELEGPLCLVKALGSWPEGETRFSCDADICGVGVYFSAQLDTAGEWVGISVFLLELCPGKGLLLRPNERRIEAGYLRQDVGS